MKKIIPSKLETGVQKFLYRTIGARIPQRVTPNQITLLGALGGLFGIVCAVLSGWNRWFLIGTIAGLLCHLICDDLDGYVARTRNMCSKAERYFGDKETPVTQRYMDKVPLGENIRMFLCLNGKLLRRMMKGGCDEGSHI